MGAVVSDGIITQDRLFEITGLRQKAALRRHLRRAMVPFVEIRGKILTTEDALTDRATGRGKKKKTGPNFKALREWPHERR